MVPIALLGAVKSFWKEIAVVILITVFMGIIYSKGYSTGKERGYNSATEEFKQYIKERDNSLIEKLNQLENTSYALVNALKINAINFNKRVDDLAKGINNINPVVINPETKECVPSEDFIALWNKLTLAQ